MEFYCHNSIIRCKWMHVIFWISKCVVEKREHMSRHPKRVNTEHIYNFTFLYECIIWFSNGTGIGTHSIIPSNYLFVKISTKLKVPSGNCCILMSKLTFNLFWHPVRSTEKRNYEIALVAIALKRIPNAKQWLVASQCTSNYFE